MGFTKLKSELRNKAPLKLAVAWGVDYAVLRACRDALDLAFIKEAVITGPENEIREIAVQNQLDLNGFTLLDSHSPAEAANKAVYLVKENRCDLLMKGHLNTSVLLRAVLNKESGLRTLGLLSHVALIELPQPRLALLTDAAMNIKPDLGQKAQILDNAIDFAWSIGLDNPKVAVLTSVETVNPQMQDTLDAAALSLMAKRKQFRKNAIVDGPLAFDNAYSKEAANLKDIDSPVAGEADIFMVPEITAGNILYKAFAYASGFLTAGIIVGAACPIVLTSRSDSHDSKLNAIAVACRSLKR
ncbi:MAG: bifunctional enoyl-CoA hydratase/phosphate acetyltransferase [Bacillota bacterium]|nr:bifunctional enoyl-CoA hydratase/phosphate acetyltransferase [Bacillota bacterium]